MAAIGILRNAKTTIGHFRWMGEEWKHGFPPGLTVEDIALIFNDAVLQ
jgi:hypothetical protein